MSEEAEVDYSSDNEIPDDDALAAIAQLAGYQLSLEKQVEEKTQELKELSARLREVSEKDLPMAMAEVGMREFTLDSGERIKVTDDWKASITGKYKPIVIKWLRENGHDDIIKSAVVAEFNKGEDDKAAGLLDTLANDGFRVHNDVNVNTTTFKALCKELYSDGVDVPLGDLGVYIVRKAVIK